MSTLQTTILKHPDSTSDNLKFDSNGNISIGNPTPVNSAGFNTLTIGNGTGTGGQIHIENSSGGNFQLWHTPTEVNYFSSLDQVFYTGGAEALRIKSDRKVTIGTTTAATNAEITLRAAAPQVSLYATPGNVSRITLGDTDDHDIGQIGYDNSDNSMFFATNTSTRLTVDGDGRVLVGKTASVTAGSAADSLVQIVGKKSSPTDLGQLTIARGNSASNLTSGAEIGEIIFSDNAGNNFAQIQCETDGATGGANGNPGRLVFYTEQAGSDSGPLERLRIAADGTFDTNTQSHGISVSTTQGAGTSKYLYRGHHTSGSTIVFNVWSNGNVESATDTYGGISDVKLKENIVDAGSQWDDIKAVRFRKYNFKEETGHETFTQLGVIAQELELTSPGLIYATPDVDEDGNELGTTTKGVKYSILTNKALVALQEAMARIEDLEAKVAVLEAG